MLIFIYIINWLMYRCLRAENGSLPLITQQEPKFSTKKHVLCHKLWCSGKCITRLLGWNYLLAYQTICQYCFEIQYSRQTSVCAALTSQLVLPQYLITGFWSCNSTFQIALYSSLQVRPYIEPSQSLPSAWPTATLWLTSLASSITGIYKRWM